MQWKPNLTLKLLIIFRTSNQILCSIGDLGDLLMFFKVWLLVLVFATELLIKNFSNFEQNSYILCKTFDIKILCQSINTQSFGAQMSTDSRNSMKFIELLKFITIY